MSIVYASSSVGSGNDNQDCIQTFMHSDSLIAIVADGAGGMSGGALASQHIVKVLSTFVRSQVEVPTPQTICTVLSTIDKTMTRDNALGESTIVVCVVQEKMIWGASVGDSEAWLPVLVPPEILTINQQRKPLMGTGLSRPVAFGPINAFGISLIGTDGLFKYAKHKEIARVAATLDPKEAVSSLIDLVTLESGQLNDDVSVVICKYQ